MTLNDNFFCVCDKLRIFFEDFPNVGSVSEACA